MKSLTTGGMTMRAACGTITRRIASTRVMPSESAAAVPPGQMEAALSLGMTRVLAIRRVIVPQAARIVIPPVVNDFIALFKDTSVCSVVTLTELTKRYSVLSMSSQATVELMVMTALLYLVMSYPMSLLASRLEKRLGTVPEL